MAKRQPKQARKPAGRKAAVVVRRAAPLKTTRVEIYKFETEAGRPSLWGFRVRARNHEIIAQGEGYTRRASARRGAVRAFPSVQIVYV